MFAHKSVVRNVFIQCADEVVAINPCILNSGVSLAAMGLGVANPIEPMSGPAFSKVFACEQVSIN